jgi:hypothetical protein
MARRNVRKAGLAAVAGIMLTAAACQRHIGAAAPMPPAQVNRRQIDDELRTFRFDTLDAQLANYISQYEHDPHC